MYRRSFETGGRGWAKGMEAPSVHRYYSWSIWLSLLILVLLRASAETAALAFAPTGFKSITRRIALQPCRVSSPPGTVPLARVHAPKSRRSAPFPSRGASPLAASSPLVDRTDFSNVNVVGWTKKLVALLAHVRTSDTRRLILESLNRLIFPADMLVIGLYSLLIPKVLHGLWRLKRALLGEKRYPKPFEQSLLHHLDEPCRFLGLSFAFLYLFDCVYIIWRDLGMRSPDGLPFALATVVYMVQAGKFGNTLLNYYLPVFFPSVAENTHQSFILRRGSSMLIWVALTTVTLELLSLQMGVALGSLLSIAGVSTLALGFSLKEIISNFLGGVIILSTNPFFPGDKISTEEFGKAEVVQIGWMRTEVRSYSDEYLRVPNSFFVGKVISNLSRRTHRMWATTLQLRCQDAPVLHDVIRDLREELKKVPKVDLRKNFYVHLKEYGPSSLDIEVELHLATNSGAVFKAGREKGLKMAYDVITSHGAELAIPAYDVSSSSSSSTEDGDGDPRGGGTMVVPQEWKQSPG